MNDLSNCAASEPFALRVIGDDMAPEFVDGHIIVVDPGGKLASGCFVVASHGGEMIFRQLIMHGDELRLAALKPDLPEIVLGGIGEIVGVVSQRSGKRRSEHKRYDDL
ncbi:MAG: S24 family peptidase [Gammaproteobacteria bacterium]|nr:S24 family peptidase [Gammaproteobacteria bacterium]MDH3534598.1 S24 family peptidase [Gammaproteobacteria bacterium]